MTRLAGGTSSENLMRYLQGATFPIRKDELVHLARRNQAPNDIVSALEQLSQTSFQSAEELIQIYPHIE